MEYFKKVIGKKCYLSPINVNDDEKYTEWLNDPEVSIHLDIFSRTLSVWKEREFLENALKGGEPIFGIIDIKTNKLIGNCGLHYADPINRCAEFGIFIGEKKFWGKGYGKEATLLMLNYAFNIINLNSIMLRVYSFNKKAIKLYEKCGFKHVGRLREARIVNGKKFDILLMDILSKEFRSEFSETLDKLLKAN